MCIRDSLGGGALRHGPGRGSDEGAQKGPRGLDGEAVLGLLPQQAGDQRRHLPRALGRGELGEEDRLEGGGGGLAAEGRDALDRLVERDPEGPQVGLRARPPPQDALGGDVLGGADEGPGLGELLLALDLGDAEVGQDDPVVAADHHVARFDVPVQDAGLVGRVERAQDGLPDPCRLPGLQGPLVEDLGQGPAPQELHHDPRPVVLHHDVVEGHHGGVVDPGRRPRLAPHALVGGAALGGGEVLRDAGLLDGHVTVHDLVPGPPHRAHAARAQAFEQPVATAQQPPGTGLRRRRRTGRPGTGRPRTGRSATVHRPLVPVVPAAPFAPFVPFPRAPGDRRVRGGGSGPW